MLLHSLVACLKWHCLPYSRKGFLWITVIRGRLQVLLAGHWEGRGSPWLSLLYLSRNSTLWKPCHDLSLPDRNAVVSHSEKAKFPMMYKEGTNIPGLTRTTLWRWQPARVESVLGLSGKGLQGGMSPEVGNGWGCPVPDRDSSSLIPHCHWASSTSGKL